MDNFKEHIVGGFKRGIDDLKGLFAFRWVETGVDYGTNSIEEYNDKESRLSFAFDCELTESAIAEEIVKRKAWNENYIKELKEQGKYGEEYSITIRMQYNPIFDKDVKELFETKLDSYNLGTIDLWALKNKDE